MATITVPKQNPPTKIDKFLGINENTAGDTQLQVGESPLMTNYRLTENYKLRKREGYSQLFGTLGAFNIRGIWYGKIGGTYYFLFACNGKVWLKSTISGTQYASIDTTTYTNVDVIKTTALNTAIVGTVGVDGFTVYQNSAGTDLTEVSQANIDLVASIGKYYYHTDGTIWIIKAANQYADIAAARTGLGTTTTYFQIGTLTDAKTFFFSFKSKVYMLNGTEYNSWNGTTFATVAGYIPLIATATPPAGGGTVNESINLLTGKKYQTFSGNNVATAYQVAETTLTSVDSVYKGAVLQTLTTDYTVDLTTGIVTFVVAPITGVDNVTIYWTKGSGSRAEITANFYAMFFGGQNDSRIFFYGDGTNRYYYTGLAAGVPSAEYIPALNYNEVGTDEFAITDIVRQYDRQIIFTNGAEAFYSYYDTFYDSTDNLIVSFPTFPLNDAVGNVATGQAQIIQNNPFSIQNGIQKWVATNVRDERNAEYISKRVQPSMDEEDLTTAITVDWEANKEYWLAIANRIWIYNYRLDAWYKFQTAANITCLYVIDNLLHFGTDAGQIMKFDTAKLTDNGTAITSTWEMNFYDFEAEWLQKFLTEMWISLKPAAKSSVNITYQTDRVGTSSTYTATYNLATFVAADFGDWSFLVNYNPQPFHFKIKAKKFVYLKITLTNSQTDDELTVLSMNLPTRYGSKVK